MLSANAKERTSMIHTTEHTHQVVSAFTCDKCGKTVQKDSLDYQEGHHINFVGGYSSVFGDGVAVECDLCQDCLKALVGPFARISDGQQRLVRNR